VAVTVRRPRGLVGAGAKAEHCPPQSGFVTLYGALVIRERAMKYTAEQKARRLRSGFEALR
jgi:hypothetical protein